MVLNQKVLNTVVDKTINTELLRQLFPDRLQENVELARYTAARIGGPAEAFLIAESAEELARFIEELWRLEIPFTILGGGSNVLVSDVGVCGVVILNRARQIIFHSQSTPPSVWAESGANFGVLARQAAARGLSGLEWAVGIPGTLGGAIVGNAGAHGADMSDNLLMAEILHQEKGNGRQIIRSPWTKEALGFAYRSSKIKREPGSLVILSAKLQLQESTQEAVEAQIEEFSGYRRLTQPTGASIGSMFKNPPGDYAGRLIELAGLKGTRVGDVQISSVHGNFFINKGGASSGDVKQLIDLTREKVLKEFGIELELEIELIGEWKNLDQDK